MISLILLIAAFICFVIAACGGALGQVNLVAAGLACWVLTTFVGKL